MEVVSRGQSDDLTERQLNIGPIISSPEGSYLSFPTPQNLSISTFFTLRTRFQHFRADKVGFTRKIVDECCLHLHIFFLPESGLVHRSFFIPASVNCGSDMANATISHSYCFPHVLGPFLRDSGLLWKIHII